MRGILRPVRRAAVIGLLLTVAATAGAAEADAGPSSAPRGQIVATRDGDTGTRTIGIRTRDGQLHWHDVLRGLAQAGDLDPAAIHEGFVDEEVARRTLDLRQSRTRWSVRAISAAIPDVRLRTVRDADTDEWVLHIQLDGREARAKVRRLKALLRARWSDGSMAYGLRADDGWQALSAERPLVVLIHGYTADERSMEGLRMELSARGWPTAVFTYPNDGPLHESAELLAKELQRWGQEHPDREVALVAHSMGGLVARAAIEDPQRDPGNVGQLIMVATPNHGTQWSELPGGLDWWEFLLEPPQWSLKEKFLASVADGLDEAHGDVRPGSDFLRIVNARPRNPRVRYSLILGTDAPFDEPDIRRIRRSLREALRKRRTGQLVWPRIDRFLDGLDEIQRGMGDGVVSVERGKLDGVPDTLLLPMAHSELTRDLNQQGRTALRDAILERLAGRVLDPRIPDDARP